MKNLIIGLSVLASISSFADTSLGAKTDFCQNYDAIHAAKMELYSKINFESDEYTRQEKLGAPKAELEKRMDKIGEAYQLVNAIINFCRD